MKKHPGVFFLRGPRAQELRPGFAYVLWAKDKEGEFRIKDPEKLTMVDENDNNESLCPWAPDKRLP